MRYPSDNSGCGDHQPRNWRWIDVQRIGASPVPNLPRVERMQQPLAQSVSQTPRAEGLSIAPLRTDALDYELPANRIATHPAEPRDSARMLVMWRGDAGSRVEHRHVCDLPEYLHTGNALVFNNTAVVPARLEMRRATGGRVEGLFLHETKVSDEAGEPRWLVMLRSGGRIAIGERLTLIDVEDRPSDLALRILEHDGERWTAALEGQSDTRAALQRLGRTPLPPYILKTRHEHHETYRDEADRNWYQTVYADPARQQSVAAPTAGLHFTPDLLKRIEAAGVKRVDVTLHVGPGTFKPVTAATLDQHRMHAEWFEVSDRALKALRESCAETRAGNRIIAVGTTSARALESLPSNALDPNAQICGPIRGSTDLLITPPHVFRHLDGMLTNFHLPRSTLLALVAAMVGLERVLAVYREAIDRGYRFYSYGDAMLILP